MKKIILPFIFFSTISIPTQAQRGGISAGATFREQTLMQFQTATDATNSKQLKGSRFYYPEYTNGELWLTNGAHFKEELVYKFDEVENSVQVKTKEGKELVVIATTIDSFRLYLDGMNTVYYYKAALPDSKKGEQRIFQVVYAGKQIFLFKIPHKAIKHYNYQGAFGDGRTIGEFTSRPKYYIKSGTRALAHLNFSKKDIAKKVTINRAVLKDELEYIDFYENITEAKVLEILQKVDKQ